MNAESLEQADEKSMVEFVEDAYSFSTSFIVPDVIIPAGQDHVMTMAIVEES